ncbi:MAG: hypothetical protein H0V66_02395 [Bdellovibrionales bacterium]|nr:hypothetical protein [Bdellovibrionales bacterium]
MSAVIKSLLLLIIVVSCNSKEAVDPLVKGETVYFPPQEVIATLNALVAIIDWPQDTIQHQKNLSVTAESATKLMLPLHPIWDEKVDEVSMEMPNWDKVKITSMISECAKRCECDFYQEVLTRYPAILEKAGPELKGFAGLKIQRTKEATLACLQNMSSIQNVLKYLTSEQKNYDAEAAY